MQGNSFIGPIIGRNLNQHTALCIWKESSRQSSSITHHSCDFHTHLSIISLIWTSTVQLSKTHSKQRKKNKQVFLLMRSHCRNWGPLLPWSSISLFKKSIASMMLKNELIPTVFHKQIGKRNLTHAKYCTLTQRSAHTLD